MAFVMDCPSDQHFNKLKNRCDKRAPTNRPINIPRQPIMPQLPIARPVEIPRAPVQVMILTSKNSLDINIFFFNCCKAISRSFSTRSCCGK